MRPKSFKLMSTTRTGLYIILKKKNKRVEMESANEGNVSIYKQKLNKIESESDLDIYEM